MREDINKLADWMMANGYATGEGDTMEDLLAELKWQIQEKIAIEREACAVVCDQLSAYYLAVLKIDANAKDCAFAIRERGAP